MNARFSLTTVATVTALAAWAMLAGCSSPGTLVLRQSGDAAPRMGKAPVDGTYGLFIAGQQEPLYEVPLTKNAPLGFDRGDDGVVRWLYAVAGTSRNRLDVTQTYDWRFEHGNPAANSANGR